MPGLPYTPPTMSELALREREMRDTLRRAGVFGADLPQTSPVAPGPEAAPPAPINLDPRIAEILFVNIISGRVVTTFGEFDLDPTERSQIAFVALNAVGRNLQRVINTLGTKYDIPKLQEQIAGATNQVVVDAQAAQIEADRKIRAAMDGLAKSDASGLQEVFPEEGEEFDEETAVPQLPKRQRSAAKR